MARTKKKRAPSASRFAALDPLGAESTNAGTGRVVGIDFARAHWVMRRAQRLWPGADGAGWMAAVRQAEAEWCLGRFLMGGWR